MDQNGKIQQQFNPLIIEKVLFKNFAIENKGILISKKYQVQ